MAMYKKEVWTLWEDVCQWFTDAYSHCHVPIFPVINWTSSGGIFMGTWFIYLLTLAALPNIPLFMGDYVSLFTILMTISTLMYTYLNSQMTASNPQMKWVMYLMPVMFLDINNYSAGLSYYYCNMINFGQQFLFSRRWWKSNSCENSGK